MKKIGYNIREVRLRACHDAAWLSDGDDLAEAVAESIIETISTDVEVALGGVKVHLAMLLSPDHWDQDWEAAGVEDVDEFLRGLVTNDG